MGVVESYKVFIEWRRAKPNNSAASGSATATHNIATSHYDNPALSKPVLQGLGNFVNDKVCDQDAAC